MTMDWKSRVEATLGGRTEVRQAPLEEALRHLRTTVPAVEFVHAGRSDDELRWSTASESLSEDLGTVLWEFMALTDAPDEEIARFARRYGPLIWPAARREAADRHHVAPERSQASDNATNAPEEAVFAEPLAAWKAYARGLRALYDLVDPAFPGGARTAGMWAESLAVIAMPLWLEDPSRPAPPLLEGELAVLALPMALDQTLVPPAWLVSSALARAGVGPVYPSARESTTGLGYTLPARAIVVAGRHLWQVQGLLPILTVSLAMAAQTQERARCTRCGKPAAIRQRGPRAGREWYGDHVWCAMEARSETMERADEKRAQKRKQRTSDARTGSPPVDLSESTEHDSRPLVE
jgi:hypothetical protein